MLIGYSCTVTRAALCGSSGLSISAHISLGRTNAGEKSVLNDVLRNPFHTKTTTPLGGDGWVSEIRISKC